MPFEPRQATRFGRAPSANDLDPFARNPVFFTVWKQHAVGSIGIERGANVGDAHGKRRAKLLRDFPKPLRAVERAGFRLPDGEPRDRPLIHEVEYRAQPIRTIGIAQASREPETSIGAADSRTRRMDATAIRVSLMDTGVSAELPYLVDTQHKTTQRTRTTCAL